MSIVDFNFNENTSTANWLASGIKTEIKNVKQAIFDNKRNLIAALCGTSTPSQLNIFNDDGLAAEILPPEKSDFQYLLPDNFKGFFIICSNANNAGTFDWKYELDLPSMRLKKIGRAY